MAAAHPGVALVIVGADGWGAERVPTAVEASPAGDRIVRPGLPGRPRPGHHFGRRLACWPTRPATRGSGFPRSQAMAAGVPVVATAAGAVPEVVGDGALVVAPGDGDGLAGAISRVLAGGDDIDDLVERGRRRSAAFSAGSACAEGLAELYGDAPPGHAGPVARPRSRSRRVEP